MAALPLVGAQAVILGMAAFSSNAKTVDMQLRQMGQGAYYLERTSSRAFAGVEASFAGVAAAALRMGVVLASATAAAAAGAITLGQRYGKELNFTGAIAQATTAQIAALDDVQIELSRHSLVSATSLAKMSTELIKAGLSFADVTGGALKSATAMVMSSNGELEAARAATILQVAMKVFGVEVEHVEGVTNAITAAVQKSSITFTQFADALRQGGLPAAALGLTIEEFSATVGLMGLRIQSGTEIGTGLRVMFERLQDPTSKAREEMDRYKIGLFDAQGAARPWFDILSDMNDKLSDNAVATGKITAEERARVAAVLGGTRGLKTLNALLNDGTKEYLKMLDAVKKLKASDVADEILRDTANAARVAALNIEALGIRFNEGLDPFVNKAVRSLVAWLQSLDINRVQAFGRAVGSTLYNAFSTLGVVINSGILPAMSRLGGVLAAAGVTWTAFSTAIQTALGNLAGLVGRALADVPGALAAANAAIGGFITNLGNVVKAVSTNDQAMATLRTAFGVVAVGAIGIATQTLILYVQQLYVATAATIASAARVAGAFLGLWIPAIAAATINIGVFIMAVGTAAVGAMLSFAATVARIAPIVMTTLIRMAAIGVAASIRLATAFAVNAALGFASFARMVALAAASTVASLTRVMLAGTVSALIAMGAAFAPFILGVAAIGGVIAQVAVAWARNWGDIQGITARALKWIVDKLNGFLDVLSSLPIIGEAIGGARAAVAGFLGGVPSFAVNATNTVKAFADEAIKSFNSIKDMAAGINFDSFTAELDAVNAAAAAARDNASNLANLREIEVPDVGTEPGGGGGDGGAADKAADAAKKAAEDLARAIERAKELVRDFNDDVLKETTRVSNDIAKLYDKATNDIAADMAEAGRDIAEAIEDSNNEIQKMHTERDIEENQKERTEALEGMLKEELRIREEQQEEIEVLHDRELEATQKAFDELQEIARRENDERLDADARARDITRQDEDRAFDKGLRSREQALEKILDAEEKAAKKLQDQQQDSLERGLRGRQDTEERALEKLHGTHEDAIKARQDLEKKALKEDQDLRESVLQGQLDAEARLRGEAADLGEIARKDAEGRAKAEAEYTKELSIGVKQSIAQARFNEKIARIQEETAADRLAFEQRKIEATADLEFEAQQEVRLQALRAQFDAEELALETKTENELRDLKERNEVEMLALKAEHTKQELALRATFEEENTKLQEDHEKRRTALRDILEQEALDRSRARAEEDRIFANEQEREKRDFAEKQERDALKESRRVQDEERVRRRGLELLETEFRKTQEDKRNALSKTLEEEDFQRKLSNIRREHDIRINQIEATLAEEQQKTRDKLAQDITDLNQNLKERIDTMRSQYVDRLEDIRRDGGEAIKGMADDIEAYIGSQLVAITEAAHTAAEALREAFDASDKLVGAQANLQAVRDRPGGGGAGGALEAPVRPGGKPGESYDEAKNYLENTGASPKEIEALIGKPRQYGGTVEGPYGAPMWIKAHGGEHFEGVGQHATILMAVRMAEAMYSRNAATGAGGTYNYNYNVEANYGRTQPEGTVRQDLSALVALTRK